MPAKEIQWPNRLRDYEKHMEQIVFGGEAFDRVGFLSDLCGFDGGAACDPVVLSFG